MGITNKVGITLPFPILISVQVVTTWVVYVETY